MITAAENDLTTALITNHNNIILPPFGTDTHINILDLAATFHKLPPPEKEATDINPIDNVKLIKTEPVPTYPAVLSRMSLTPHPSKTNQLIALPTTQTPRMGKTPS